MNDGRPRAAPPDLRVLRRARACAGRRRARRAGRDPRRLAAPPRRARRRPRIRPRTSCGCSTRSPSSRPPTACRRGGRWWYGNCAWDAFGICAALHADGRIETSCPDCGEPLAVEVRDERPDDESLLFHCPRPGGAAGGTTSSSPEATMNLFRSEEHIARWLGGREPGATIPVAKLARAGARLVGRPARARLGAAHARAEPGDPRAARPHRRVLGACPRC